MKYKMFLPESKGEYNNSAAVDYHTYRNLEIGDVILQDNIYYEVEYLCIKEKNKVAYVKRIGNSIKLEESKRGAIQWSI